MTSVNQPTFVMAAPAADAEHETEVVPGEKVSVLETQGEWAYVVVPSHASTKDERGYPGWLPTAALAQDAERTVETGDGVEALLAKARTFLGVPYVWGGTTDAGIDCSGLVFRAAEAIGVRLPRDARDQAAALAAIDIDDVAAGDLYFFAQEPGGRITHVAIATAPPAPDGVRPMIHADGDKMGVVEESMSPGRLTTLAGAARFVTSGFRACEFLRARSENSPWWANFERMTRTGALSPQSRDLAIGTMVGAAGETELDVLVVGGGVTGAGVALDAVTRGLNTGLVEERDLASGTSSRSSKLVHGGLRYLEMLDFELVREALQERGLLLNTLAPHLVRPVPFLYPLTNPVWERAYIGAGLAIYDAMASFGPLSGLGNSGLPRHRHLTRRGVARIAPDFRTDAITGAIQYYDAQVDDARLVLTIARTAASHGAHIATRVQVTGFLREGERVVGVRARDLEHDQDLVIRAKTVVNAAGVWTDEIQAMVGGRGALHVKASKGIHLVVPRDRIRSESGFIVRTEKSVLFVIPWGRHWIIGTTDTPWSYDLAHPAASKTDIEYVLEHVNAILREPLDIEDVEGVYAGLRPLLTGESDQTATLSREHTVVTPLPGLVLIAGGKLTTYRVMAKDAVDAAAHSLGTTTNMTLRDSITDKVRLVGAEGFETRSNQRVLLARRSGLHVARIDHLLGRHGGLIDDILDLIQQRRPLALPLEGAEDYLAAEVVYAVTNEGARHLDDVLERRTRISMETFDRGVSAAPGVAKIMAEELGWDDRRTKEEVDHYLRRIEAERRSQLQVTDEEADRARHEVEDLV